MSASNFADYANGVSRLLESILGTGLTRLADLKIEPRAARLGLIASILAFEDESELHFREYVDLSMAEPRIMYAYHYQDAAGVVIFRYDNAAHRPTLSQPEHKHTPAGIVLCPARPWPAFSMRSKICWSGGDDLGTMPESFMALAV